MIFSVIGDIRGDLKALHAVLDHVENAGIQVILHAGNAVVGGPDGDAVIDRLRRAGVHCVLGAEDKLAVRFSRKREALRKRLEPELFTALEAAHARLGSGNLEFLAHLHASRHVEIDNMSIYVCADADSRRSGPDLPPARLRRLREQALADVILCGGAAEPFTTTVDGTLIVFPGPLHAGPGLARYALVDTDGPSMAATFPEVSFAP